ncbi:hypothetical protein [Undibacterium sp. TS12]|uniref:hypothetical protein n=1 Tax=Undibacterium sp. TS12 TaxID=2908202 RepID=UPI001F4D2C45|nr:hypothetical protein [Undibacterium sp. TS12]MCH8618209.1 hypothetical protein [Undibacterium sp. TS12]
MTSRDDNMHNSEYDAEFEDFLQGQGELASLLQNLEQEQPSAELDAAILSDAARVLNNPAINPVTAIAPAAQPANAANDAKGPSGSGAMPGFLWRWKLPLGLAASVLFAIPVVMEYRQQTEQDVMVAATSPAKDIQPQPVMTDADKIAPAAAPDIQAVPETARAEVKRKAVAPEPAVDAANDKFAEKSDKKNDRAAPELEKSRLADNQVADARRAAHVAPAAVVPPVAMSAPPAPSPAPAPAAPMPAQVIAEAAPAATTGMQLAERKAYANAAPAAKPVFDATARESSGMAAPVPGASRTRVADASNSKEEALQQLAKKAEAETRPLTAMSKSAPPPVEVATRPAPVMARADNKSDAAAIGQIAPARVSAAPPAPSASIAPETPLSPDEWLQKIERLLKAGQDRLALDEWKKFRLSYPGFAVSKQIQTKMEELQNSLPK